MATYRFYNPAPVLLDQNGLKPLAGGSVSFFEIGTTTKKDTWSDPAGGSGNLNPNPITIDADGRLHTDVFLDGDYTVLIEGLDGTTLTRDIPGPDAGQTIPSPTAGWFLTSTDGTNLAWAQVLQLPDPTGQNGKILSTDGSNFIWISQQSIPDPPEPDIVVDADNWTFKAGVSSNTSKFSQQFGTGTAPATNALTSSVTITFPTPFDKLFHVGIMPRTSGVTSNSPPALPSWAVTGFTPGGAASSVTVTFYAPPVQTVSPEDNIVSSVPFAWAASGILIETE